MAVALSGGIHHSHDALKTLFALAPSLILLLICCVSPVNGYLRYMLPIMAALPVQMWFCVAASAVRLGREPASASR